MTSRVRMPGRRRRGLALVAVTALVGVPLLAGGPTTASAGTVGQAGTVTFSGGCGLLGSGLGARSSPDAEQVSLPAGSGVRFANQLGQAATLRLDGEAAADVPDGGSADVVFHEGPVTATMQIDCLLGESAGAVLVEVARAPQARPQPPSGSGGSASPDGSSAPGATGSPTRPSGSGGTSPDQPGGAGVPSAQHQPSGTWPGVPAAPGAQEPPSREGPAGAPSAPADGVSPRWGLATEPSHSGDGSADRANVDRQAAGEFADQELARTSGSGPGEGSTGLLALVATVCVVGVSAGAIRAIISQRADRAAVS